MIVIKSVLGPNPYVAATGVLVTFGEGDRILNAIAKCDNSDGLAANDTARAIRTVITNGATGCHVHVLVDGLATVGGPGNAWAELIAGNFSGRTFTVIADVE
ncbi:MAG: hypothetical protein V1767_00920 [Chloroflexota bacterium]